MKIDDLHYQLMSWGYFLDRDQWAGFRQYLARCIRRNRLLAIWKEDHLEALVTFFQTKDYDKLYRKTRWTVPDEDPDGHQVYLDKMVARKWTPSLRRLVQTKIENLFPTVTEAYWHREPYDRLCKVSRRDVCTV